MIRIARELSPDQRAAIEEISVRAIDSPALTDERRKEVLRGLETYFAKVDAQRQAVSDEGADAIINEALRSTRPNYRSVHFSV